MLKLLNFISGKSPNFCRFQNFRSFYSAIKSHLIFPKKLGAGEETNCALRVLLKKYSLKGVEPKVYIFCEGSRLNNLCPIMTSNQVIGPKKKNLVLESQRL